MTMTDTTSPQVVHPKPMRRLSARLHREDDGISLVEVLVAMSILSVVLAAVLSTIVTSLRVVQRNESRVRATALSQETLETMTAVSWDRLGLYVSEAPAVTFEGDDTVLLPNETTRDPLVPMPSETISRDGRAYTVQRWVTWVDRGSGQDYKRAVTQISWDVAGSTQMMRSEALRAADPAEATNLRVEFATLENGTTGLDEIPLRDPSFGAPHYNTQPIEIEVEVTDPTAAVDVIYDDRGGNSRTISLTAASTTRNATIPAGSVEFANGPLALAVTAVTLGPDGEVASNTGTLNFYEPLRIDTPQVVHEDGTPPLCVDASGIPVSPAALNVDVDGVTVADGVASAVTLDDGRATGPAIMEPTVDTLDGASFTNTLPGPYGPGSLTLTVEATRDVDDPALDGIVSFALTVTVSQSGTTC